MTLSLFYTGDISYEDCAGRFHHGGGYVGRLYDADGELTEEIQSRYEALMKLLREHSELIEGSGNFRTPAHPTFTSCRLTDAGQRLAITFLRSFPAKPEFPNWPDKRTAAGVE